MRSPWLSFLWFICIIFTTCSVSCVADVDGYEFEDEGLRDDDDAAASDHSARSNFHADRKRHAQQPEKDRPKLLLEQQATQQDGHRNARTAARRKQKRDARIVQQVLQAHAAENLYGVLGLFNNRYWHLPKRIVTIIPKYCTVELPEVYLFYATQQRIKRAYRERAKQTHPDKNSDDRAVQAFRAVDQAAEVLMNPEQRMVYDRAVQLRRQEHRQRLRSILQKGVERVLGVGKRGVGILRTILGPFFVPFTMLFVLMF